MSCGCRIHDGETHAEHMRRLEHRMAKEKMQAIFAGVRNAYTKAAAGEPVTQYEADAIRYAVIAVDAVRRDLYLHLIDIDRWEQS